MHQHQQVKENADEAQANKNFKKESFFLSNPLPLLISNCFVIFMHFTYQPFLFFPSL